MDIPAEIRLKATIRTGSVFYFTEESWDADYPHNFVVLNQNPIIDSTLILVGATTLDIKIFYRIKDLPRETIVNVDETNCPFLNRPSHFNCNVIVGKKIEHLIAKLESGNLKIRPDYVSVDILEKIRLGVKASPLIDKWIKKLL